MNTTKLTAIKPTGKTWESPTGPIHYFHVILEDGTEGEVGSLKESGPPYKQGDNVEYEVTKDHPTYGKKLKVKKAQGGFGGGGYQSKPAPAKKDYDPLPGFCATNIAFCIQEARNENGGASFSVDDLVEKMVKLHKLHAEVTEKVRQQI